MIDHVVAAISVKSTVRPSTFEEAWNSIQSIPAYPNPAKDHPAIVGHAWPLCYVLAGETASLEDVAKQWAALAAKVTRHSVQLLVALNRGYAYPGNVCWPMRAFNRRDPESHRVHQGLEAGLGLGWILTGITARVSLLNSRGLASIDRMARLLDRSESLSAESPMYDRKHSTVFLGHQPILGKLAWGSRCRWLHNNLLVHSVTLAGKELENLAFPARHPFPASQRWEPRWFDRRQLRVDQNVCWLEEWLPDASMDRINVHRVAMFDCGTGDELPPGNASQPLSQ